MLQKAPGLISSAACTALQGLKILLGQHHYGLLAAPCDMLGYTAHGFIYQFAELRFGILQLPCCDSVCRGCVLHIDLTS